MIMQQSVMLKEVSYENWRDHLINIVTQKNQLRKPTDMDLGNIYRDRRQDTGDEEPPQAEYSDDWWELEAIRGKWKGGGKGKGCWNCGSQSHYQRDCPEPLVTPKGKGKGSYTKGSSKGKGNYSKGVELLLHLACFANEVLTDEGSVVSICFE